MRTRLDMDSTGRERVIGDDPRIVTSGTAEVMADLLVVVEGWAEIRLHEEDDGSEERGAV